MLNIEKVLNLSN